MKETKEHFCTKCQKMCSGIDCECTKTQPIVQDFEVICDENGQISEIKELTPETDK